MKIKEQIHCCRSCYSPNSFSISIWLCILNWVAKTLHFTLPIEQKFEFFYVTLGILLENMFVFSSVVLNDRNEYFLFLSILYTMSAEFKEHRWQHPQVDYAVCQRFFIGFSSNLVIMFVGNISHPALIVSQILSGSL